MRVAIAFSAALTAVLLLGALLRTMARRRRSDQLRRSGGLVLIVTAPIGLAVTSAVPDRAVAVVGGALALALFGYIRDRIVVPRWVVPIVMLGVAGAVTTSGLRFPVGGVPAVDFVWTVLWLTLVTTAVAGSGNADGQLPSLAGASALGIMALAGFASQDAAAALMAALLGGLIGFLAYNLRPASLSMGRGGALFSGFMIAAGAIWVHPTIGRPDSLLISLMLVAVALLDGLLVVVSRLRHGRPVTVRVRDHIAHRLVAAGLRPTRAIELIVVVQVVLSVIAVFVGRGVLSLALGGLLAGLLLAALLFTALRARMSERARGFSGWVWAGVFGVVGFVIVAAIPAAAAAFSSRSDMLTARDFATQAVQAARDGDSARAAALFANAEREFASAHDRIGSVVTMPSLVVPVLGSNVHAARELSRIGVELSRAGRELAEQVNSDELRFVDGRVPLENVAAAAPEFASAARALEASRADLQDIPTSYLVSQIKDGVSEVRGDVAGAARDAARAADAARVAPLVLGQDQPRRYLLLVQNPAELRGTGGLVGNWGILTAANGTIELEKLERVGTLNTLGNPSDRVLNAPKDYVERYARFDPVRTLQNANISPDFPTVSAVMSDVYGQSASPPVDGVIAVDPIGLAALMELTGPVRVEGWPTPINAQNVVDVTLRDAYQAFARTPERADFLGDVAQETIDRATSGDLGNLAALSRSLGKAAHGGHISLWFTQPEEQRVVDDIAIGGRVPTPSGDSLLVTNTNAGGNKLDYYLQRAIDYSVTVTPSGNLSKALTEGTVTVALDNTVPPEGVAQIAAGPYEGATDRFVYGQNHSFLSVYTPLSFTAVRINDQPTGVEGATELGRNVYSSYVDAFSQGSASMALDLSGIVDLTGRGWYELTLVRQPTLRPDPVTVRIAVPDGFEILESRGIPVVDGVAQGTIGLDRTRTVRVRIGKQGGGSVWDRLRYGS